MNKRILLPLSASVGALSLGLVVAKVNSAEPMVPILAPRTASAAPTLPAASGEAAVVDAANAFLATLSDQQRSVAQIELAPRLAARWSNFPAGFSPRNGVFFRDLNPTQVAAALKVARSALSKEGFARFQEIRDTDGAFAKIATGPGGGRGPGGGPGGGGGFRGRDRDGFGGPGGPPPGDFSGQGGPGQGPGGGNLFGPGNYIIAFLGKPSKTTPWLLQLGGHHLAFNIYYKPKLLPTL